MTSRLLSGIVGLVFVRAGWRAWTGRWRSWAHPCQEWGVVPLGLLPIGLLLSAGLLVDTADDTPSAWWILFAPALLAAVPAIVLLGVSLFYTPRRLPGLLRPRWLPADWQVPAFKYVRQPPEPSPDPSRPASEDEVAQRFGSTPVLAQWDVWYMDQDGSPAGAGMLIPGVRWCWMRVFPDVVTVSHRRFEDGVQGRTFVLVLRPGQIQDVSFVTRAPIRWSMRHAHRLDRPYLRIRTTGGEHVLAMVDLNFPHRLEKNLDLVAGALQADVQR